MNLKFFGLPEENAVVREMMEWSNVALNTPHPFFNGLPPCPYAKQAWLENKVAVLFKYEDNYQTLYSTISQFQDTFDVAIIVDMENKLDNEDFHTYLDGLNLAISEGFFIDRDIWLMGFHPEDEVSEFEEDVPFEPLVNHPYSMIFVQRLSKLQEAADKLRKKGYYDGYDDGYNAQDIFELREKLHRRLKNGDESS